MVRPKRLKRIATAQANADVHNAQMNLERAKRERDALSPFAELVETTPTTGSSTGEVVKKKRKKAAKKRAKKA